MLLVVSGALFLIGATNDTGLPDGYWQHPKASVDRLPRDWSPLEANLHPAACAQCHSEQFQAWRHSRHARAYSAGMVGQFLKMGYKNANDCLVCHAPLNEQAYRSDRDLQRSLQLLLKHGEGFDEANISKQLVPLRYTGVSCAVCHVRHGRRFGPPRKGNPRTGRQQGAAHTGFIATRAFESSQFCGVCHQFPNGMEVNGKPLENTLHEWQQSAFPSQGVTCQQCHMPGRRHEFRGIHDPEMTRKGLTFQLEKSDDGVLFSITSSWIGHAFPTYVTPKVVVVSEAMDRSGQVLKRWRWDIVREVAYRDGWQEIRDTRILPGETRRFVAKSMPIGTEAYHVAVRVIPDHFYQGIYAHLLQSGTQDLAVQLIQRARKQALQSDYVLYEQSIRFTSIGGD